MKCSCGSTQKVREFQLTQSQRTYTIHICERCFMSANPISSVLDRIVRKPMVANECQV